MAETKTQTLLGDPPVPHARPATARRPATRSVIRTGPSPPSLSPSSATAIRRLDRRRGSPAAAAVCSQATAKTLHPIPL